MVINMRVKDDNKRNFMKLQDIAPLADILSQKLDEAAQNECQYFDDLQIYLEQMSQQAHMISQDLREITNRLGI